MSYPQLGTGPLRRHNHRGSQVWSRMCRVLCKCLRGDTPVSLLSNLLDFGGLSGSFHHIVPVN